MRCVMLTRWPAGCRDWGLWFGPWSPMRSVRMTVAFQQMHLLFWLNNSSDKSTCRADPIHSTAPPFAGSINISSPSRVRLAPVWPMVSWGDMQPSGRLLACMARDNNVLPVFVVISVMPCRLITQLLKWKVNDCVIVCYFADCFLKPE